jgi:hypothetical protein
VLVYLEEYFTGGNEREYLARVRRGRSAPLAGFEVTIQGSLRLWEEEKGIRPNFLLHFCSFNRTAEQVAENRMPLVVSILVDAIDAK